MFRAIGFLIILWGLSLYFPTAFDALDDAARESFKTIETASVAAQSEITTKL
jgi:hypothetical protein